MKTFKFLNKPPVIGNWNQYERKVLNMVRYHNRQGTNALGDFYDFYDDQNRVVRIDDMFNINGRYFIDYRVTIYHTHSTAYRMIIEYSTLENILRQNEDL